MGLIAPADEERLREAFAGMTRPVRLLFFTQAIGCDTCVEARQIVDELPLLSDKIRVDEVNVVLDRDTAAAYGIDRVPALALVSEDDAGAVADSRIRFLGAPSGYEFISLVQAVRLVGGCASTLSDANLARLAEVDTPLTVQVFSTPSCPHCPRAVGVAHEMAFASPKITAYAVEATEFPDLTRRYAVTGVPKTVVEGGAARVEILGALPTDDFIAQALGDQASLA